MMVGILRQFLLRFFFSAAYRKRPAASSSSRLRRVYVSTTVRVIFPGDLRRPRGVVSDRFAYILWEVMCLTVVAQEVMGPH